MTEAEEAALAYLKKRMDAEGDQMWPWKRRVGNPYCNLLYPERCHCPSCHPEWWRDGEWVGGEGAPS